MTSITPAQKKAMKEIVAQTKYGFMNPEMLDQRTFKALQRKGFIQMHPNNLLAQLSDAGRDALQNADKPKPVSEAAAHPRFLALPAEEQQERLALRAEFMSITRGVHAYKLSQLMNSVTSGIDWCGCTKGHLADEWLNCSRYTTRHFNDGTLTSFVQRLDTYLAKEAAKERMAKVWSETRDHRDVVDWAHLDKERQQREDLTESAQAELDGAACIPTSHSRSGLAKRGYMHRYACGDDQGVKLTPKGWGAAARRLAFMARGARHRRDVAQENVRNWGWRGDKDAEKLVIVEKDREYRRLIAQAERALERSRS